MILTPNYEFSSYYRGDYVLNPFNTSNCLTIFEILSDAGANTLINDDEFIASLMVVAGGNPSAVGSMGLNWLLTGEGPSIPGLGFVYPTVAGWLGLCKNVTKGAIKAGRKPELDYTVFRGISPNPAPDYIISEGADPYNNSLYHYKLYSSVWLDFSYIINLFKWYYADKGVGYAEYLGLDVLGKFSVNLNIPYNGYVSAIRTAAQTQSAVNSVLNLLPQIVNQEVKSYRYLPGTPNIAHKLFGGDIYALGSGDDYTTSYFLEGIGKEFVGDIPETAMEAYTRRKLAGKYADMQGYRYYMDHLSEYTSSLGMFATVGTGTSTKVVCNPYEIAEETRMHITYGEVGYPTFNRKASLPVGVSAGDSHVTTFAVKPFTAYAIPYSLQVKGFVIPSAVINCVYLDIEPVKGVE